MSEEQNFEQLRRLMALKRHEQPPPGYFHGFSRQVIARIEAGETAASQPWWQRFLGGSGLFRGFETKPLIAGAFGVGICSLLIVGVVSSERIDNNPVGLTIDGKATVNAFATVPSQVGFGSSLFERAAVEHIPTGQVFTAQSHHSIFDEIQNPHVQPVNYSLPLRAN